MSSHDRICACVSEIDRREATAGLPSLDTPLEAWADGSTKSRLGGSYGKQKLLLRGTGDGRRVRARHSAFAQNREAVHFRGIINDFTPATSSQAQRSLGAPWRMAFGLETRVRHGGFFGRLDHGEFRLLARDQFRSPCRSRLTCNSDSAYSSHRSEGRAGHLGPDRRIQRLPHCQLQTSDYDWFYGYGNGEHYWKWRLSAICT